MTNEQKTQFRAAFIYILDDENGINESGYFKMADFAFQFDEFCGDICRATESSDGRVYLSEEHGLVA